MMRFVETFSGGLRTVVEGKHTANPRLYLEGIGQTTKPNRNGRVYPRELWEYMFHQDEGYRFRLEKGRLLGGLGHPKDGIFDPMNSCLVLREQYLKGDDVQVRLECVTNTPGGQVIKALADVGVELGVSSRGSGDAEYRAGYEYVLPGFYLEGYDAVVDPSVAHANPSYLKDIKKSLEQVKSDPESRYMAKLVMESFDRFQRATRSQSTDASNVIFLSLQDLRLLEQYIQRLERKAGLHNFLR